MLALAFALSFLPALLEFASGGALSFGESSHLALASLPWLALAGLPQRRGARGPTASRAVAAALPPLTLAAGLDRASAGGGGVPLVLLGELGVALALIGLWAEVGWRSAARGGAFGALCWLCLVPGLAALRLALVFAPSTSGAPPAAGPALLLTRANPLYLFLEAARAGRLDAVGALVSLALALLVLGAELGLGRRAREGAP